MGLLKYKDTAGTVHKIGCRAFADDTFTDTTGTTLQTHVADDGGTWTRLPREMSATSSSSANAVITSTGKVQAAVAGDESAGYYHSAPVIDNYEVSVDFVMTTIGTTGRWELGANIDHDDSQLQSHARWALTYRPSLGQWQLTSITAATATFGTYSATYTSGSTVRAAIRVQGTSLKAYADGVQIISATVAAVTTEKRCGIGAPRPEVGSVDNFTITDLSQPGRLAYKADDGTVWREKCPGSTSTGRPLIYKQQDGTTVEVACLVSA